MKLATFTHDGSTRIGMVTGNEIVDLATAAPNLPREMVAFLAGGAAAMAAARLELAEVQLAAPILRPPKFLAIGLNYADHVKESGLEVPPVPIFFNKQSTCVTGPHDPIHLPRVSPLLDYE